MISLVQFRSSFFAAAYLMTMVAIGPARAQQPAPEDWRTEFEAVCVKTDLAMTLTDEELADLVARCDRLAERIGAEGEIVRKVYLKRLQSCRALFVFVLDSRKAPPPGASASPPTPENPSGPRQPSAETPPAPEGRPAP